jgi:3',5'-cyclic AMP phosphodiesterase CpdA
MRSLFSFLLSAAFLIAASIVDPRWGAPIYVTPGSSFNITLDAPAAVNSVALAAPGAPLIQLKFTASGNVITANIPPDTPLGLYDIVINGGEIYEPKAVWVGNVTGPLRILQLTDEHMGVELDMASVYRLIHGALYANSAPVDVVFFTGDQADVGGQAWHHLLFVRYASTITKPVFVIPGNHDHAGDDPLVNYRKYQGLPYWYRVVGPYLIVGLDTGHDGYLTDEQVKFYESVLARHPDKVKIVLMHHPPFYLQNSYVVETYRGPQDIDRLSRDPTGRRPYYLVYTSHLQNRAGFEKFLNLTFRYKVAVVMSGHVHGGNSTIIINGTYFVTTRTLGGSIDTSHGFRTYVVFPNGTVKVDPEVWTYKKFAVVTWGSKAAQIYIDSDMVSGTLAVDLPGDYAGVKALNGTAELVKAEKHPLGKYTRYVIKLSGQTHMGGGWRTRPSPQDNRREDTAQKPHARRPGDGHHQSRGPQRGHTLPHRKRDEGLSLLPRGATRLPLQIQIQGANHSTDTGTRRNPHHHADRTAHHDPDHAHNHADGYNSAYSNPNNPNADTNPNDHPHAHHHTHSKPNAQPHWRCVCFYTGGRHADCDEFCGHRGACGPLWATC